LDFAWVNSLFNQGNVTFSTICFSFNNSTSYLKIFKITLKKFIQIEEIVPGNYELVSFNARQSKIEKRKYDDAVGNGQA